MYQNGMEKMGYHFCKFPESIVAWVFFHLLLTCHSPFVQCCCGCKSKYFVRLFNHAPPSCGCQSRVRIMLMTQMFQWMSMHKYPSCGQVCSWPIMQSIFTMFVVLRPIWHSWKELPHKRYFIWESIWIHHYESVYISSPTLCQVLYKLAINHDHYSGKHKHCIGTKTSLTVGSSSSLHQYFNISSFCGQSYHIQG